MMSGEKITTSSIDMESQIGESETLLGQVKTTVCQNKLAALAAVVTTVIVLVTIFTPLAASCNPYAQTLADRPQTSSAAHILGMDGLGRDVFSRIIHGTRVPLMAGSIPTVISMTTGTILGLPVRFYGGKIGFAIMRLASVVLVFPSLLLAVIIIYTIGGGLVNIFTALILVNWTGVARIIGSQALSLREAEYVKVVRSIGIKEWKVMFRRILPNCLPSLIVLFTLNISVAILTESSLSFLGAGLQPPPVSWGLVVVRGRKYLFSGSWLSIAPSVTIMTVVMAFNSLGDEFRGVLDPYLKEQ